MSKAIRSSLAVLTVCFAMAAGAQNSIQVGKDGKVKFQSGASKLEVNNDGDEATLETSGTTAVEVEAEDGDSPGGKASASSSIELSGTARQQTVACSKGTTEVVIKGASNAITLTGECKRVSVHGSANAVTIETVGEIDVKGTANSVSWKKALGGAKKPKVNSSGTANQVSKAE